MARRTTIEPPQPFPEGPQLSDSSSHEHARANLTVEERIDYIAGLMERLEWVRGKTGKQLAEQWGLAVSTVEGNAAEAHRRVVGDKDEAIRDITAGARRLMQTTLAANDAKAFTAVANLLADVSGAKAPTKQELAIGPVTSASAAAAVREAFGEKALPRDMDPEDIGELGALSEEPPSE